MAKVFEYCEIVILSDVRIFGFGIHACVDS